MGDKFYDARLEQSAVKSEIVSKYFAAWARVMLPQADRIAYVDLFCGPGVYRDGNPSTPVLVLDLIANDPRARAKVATFFNDVEPAYVERLESALTARDYSALAYKPQLSAFGAQDALNLVHRQIADSPTLYFVDPWGYKGVTLDLLAKTVCDWGCECILFFNFNRLNAAVDNDLVSAHVEALFGPEATERLRSQLEGVTPSEREATVLEAIMTSLKQAGARYVLPFRFVDQHGTRTSHHLMFLTKHVLGYTIMKDVMDRASSDAEQGVPALEYNPATIRQPLLFEYARPLDELADLLLTEFAGRELAVRDVFDGHHVGRRYVKRNYKHALLALEQVGKIACTPSVSDRRKGTIADHVRVKFPGAQC